MIVKLWETVSLNQYEKSGAIMCNETTKNQERMTEQIIENEFRLSVIEILLEVVVSKNPGILTNDDIKQSQDRALANLQKKYPDSGIQLSPQTNKP